MRASVYYGPGDIRIEHVADPRIEQPTDALVRITHACICGSDLWPYRGINNGRLDGAPVMSSSVSSTPWAPKSGMSR